ncbi:MAG: TetR/AcrR family transcriptional regulator [Dehalococcoidales bacterium]|jgi:AcrR family transcriptional regulator|nr:TetR/AcrR family transcriptional regulator [Dehalococcoidales bacterium]
MELKEYKHVKNDEKTLRLMEAVVALISERHVDSITESDIIERAGLTQKEFNTCFPNKQSLINYVYYDAVKDLDESFKRYDTFARTTINLKKEFAGIEDFLPHALESKQDDSLSSFVSYYWIKFNQDLYKEATGAKTIPARLETAIEKWVYELVEEMRSSSMSNSKSTREYYSSLQLLHTPKEIRKILIMNSIKAGVTLKDMGLDPDELSDWM